MIKLDGICRHVIKLDGIWRHVIKLDGIWRHVIKLDGIWRHVIKLDGIWRHVIKLDGMASSVLGLVFLVKLTAYSFPGLVFLLSVAQVRVGLFLGVFETSCFSLLGWGNSFY